MSALDFNEALISLDTRLPNRIAISRIIMDTIRIMVKVWTLVHQVCGVTFFGGQQIRVAGAFWKRKLNVSRELGSSSAELSRLNGSWDCVWCTVVEG
jgi:hypothetical protein